MAKRFDQLFGVTAREPLVGQKTALLTIVGFWLFYIIIISLRAAVLEFPEQMELATRRGIVAITGVFITWLLYRVLILFDKQPLSSRIALAFAAAIPSAFAIAGINHIVFNVFDPMSLFEDPEIARQVDAIEQQLGYSVWQDILDSAITLYYFLIAWASMFLALGYAREVAEAERVTARFARAAHDAELRSLRYQVNPHFLFNTLNSLSSLVIKGQPERAEEMIQNLSTFYRTSLASDPLADVSLAQEVELQKQYLAIEAVRFPERLKVIYNIDPVLEDVPVPALILQPLVENAIKHGVAQSTKKVVLAITAERMGDRMLISVSDDAVDSAPIFPSVSEGSGGGIGLTNVRDRLSARYGDDASFDSHPRPGGGFTATINLPFEKALA